MKPGFCRHFVTGDEAVDVDMGRLLKELGSVFESKEISDMLSGNVADESSSASDPDLDENSDGTSDDEMEASDATIAQPERSSLQGSGSQNSAEKAKQKDTDFNDEYSNVLDLELKNTSLAKSFAKGKEIATTSENATLVGPKEQNTAKSEPRAVARAEIRQDDSDENDLVDADVNLVESLLRSFAFQQGMPGPASNLLGAMGIDLPDDADQRPVPRWKETVVWESRAGVTDDVDSSSDDDA